MIPTSSPPRNANTLNSLAGIAVRALSFLVNSDRSFVGFEPKAMALRSRMSNGRFENSSVIVIISLLVATA